MPPRRTRARQPSSDGIEDQVVTQRAAQEDVSDGDSSPAEQPQQRHRQRTATATGRTRVTKANTSARESTSNRRKKASAASSSSDEDSDTNEPAPEIDVLNFRDQPISKNESGKVSLLAGDWDNIIKQVEKTALKIAIDAAAGMAEAGLGKDEVAATEELETIESAMRELLDVRAELKLNQATLVELTNRIATGEQISDIVNQFDKGVQDRIKAYSSKTSRQKYAKEEKYIEYKSNVYEVQNPGEPMPPVSQLIPKEDGDESDEDDDIEVGGVTQDYKCPISLTTLVDPMRSGVCKHFFSGGAIREYFKQNSSARKKCPATGCGAMFGLGDLHPDKDLERKVKAFKRREMARRAEQKSDDEDDDGEVL